MTPGSNLSPRPSARSGGDHRILGSDSGAPGGPPIAGHHMNRVFPLDRGAFPSIDGFSGRWQSLLGS